MVPKRRAKVNFRLPKGAPKQPATSSSIGSEGATPFLFAADREDVPLMRLLLELGADPLLPNFNNTTPLMAAAGVGTNEPQEEAGVATVDVADIKAEAERLRAEGIEVGTVLELHGQMRLLDVYDPDGNRIQLAEELSRG